MRKLGLALGGGVARGFAHLGVIDVFIQEGISFDFVAGTSAGSMVGAFFSAGVNIDLLLEDAVSLNWGDFAKVKFSRKALFSYEPLDSLVRKYIGNMTFSDLAIPFSALATDIIKGESYIINEPNIEVALAVCASSSFPGFFAPVKIGDKYLSDGGASGNVPAKVLRDQGSDIVIAVDVIPHVELDHPPRHMISMIDRGLDILLHGISQQTYHLADIVIKPIQNQITSFSFKKSKKIIEYGRQAALACLPQIKDLIGK